MPRRIVTAAVVCALWVACSCAAAPDQKPKRNERVTDAARDALREMAHAYARLHEIEQVTTFSDPDGISGQGTIQLAVKRPNRLRVEAWPRGADVTKPPASLLQCDGKLVYNFLAAQGNYRCDLAPKRLSDFSDRASTIELLALTGVEPFAALDTQVRAARVDEGETIEGMPTQQVILEVGTDERPAEVRIYLGAEDHLIRRFLMTSAGLPSKDGTVTKPLTFSYDNHIVSTSQVKDSLFVWIPPANSYLANPAPGRTAPKARETRPKKIQYGVFGADGKPIKPAKTRSLEEILKDARKRK